MSYFGIRNGISASGHIFKQPSNKTGLKRNKKMSGRGYFRFSLS